MAVGAITKSAQISDGNRSRGARKSRAIATRAVRNEERAGNAAGLLGMKPLHAVSVRRASPARLLKIASSARRLDARKMAIKRGAVIAKPRRRSARDKGAFGVWPPMSAAASTDISA